MGASSEGSDFLWVVRETKIHHLTGNNQLEDKKVVIIAIKNNKTGIILPHPITHFIRQSYDNAGNSLSSQMNAARELTKFLNYVEEQVAKEDPDFMDLKEKGFPGIKLIHFSRYITHCAQRKLAYKYVKNSIERYLIQFYVYLVEMKLVEQEIQLETYTNRRGHKITKSPFSGPTLNTKYPSKDGLVKNKLKDFGDDHEKQEQILEEFIEEARRVVPEIAFGIGLQVFGGLRRGEVVNISTASFPPDFLNGVNHIAVLDNQERLFSHLQNTIKEQVKRQRIQPVLPSEYLRELYDDHIEMGMQVKKENPYAFFVNAKGKTISGGDYEKKFKKAKDAYLKRLAETPGRYTDFWMLDETTWSTHIGRGVFSNYLLKMKMDDRQMAILRGDKSTESAKDYIDYKKAIKDFKTAMNILSTKETLDAGTKLMENWEDSAYGKSRNQ